MAASNLREKLPRHLKLRKLRARCSHKVAGANARFLGRLPTAVFTVGKRNDP
jgi:hypothetical protein